MINDFDKKELFLIKTLGERFVNHTFAEYDVLSFLILIRSHLDRKKGNQRSKYHVIFDFADLVAHRHRDKGIAFDAAGGAIRENYALKNDGSTVKGYHGVHYDNNSSL